MLSNTWYISTSIYPLGHDPIFCISILENIWRLSLLRIFTLYTIIAVSLIGLTPNRKTPFYIKCPSLKCAYDKAGHWISQWTQANGHITILCNTILITLVISLVSRYRNCHKTNCKNWIVKPLLQGPLFRRTLRNFWTFWPQSKVQSAPFNLIKMNTRWISRGAELQVAYDIRSQWSVPRENCQIKQVDWITSGWIKWCWL